VARDPGNNPWSGAEADHTHARGCAAEALAADWLVEQGYRIVDRNVRTKAGEIDLIAIEGEVLCFVEVKARTSRRYGSPLAAVDRRKQRRLARAAALYLAARPVRCACRFDVVGMESGGDGWRFTLVRNAFTAAY